MKNTPGKERNVTEKEVSRLIERTVNRTVLKMKMAGLLKDNRRTAVEKTEEVLRDFPTFKETAGNRKETAKMVLQIEQALATIKSDPYYEIIEMFYFDGVSREMIAGYFDTTPTTISRNKTRLIRKLSIRLFSAETIQEIFLN